MKTIIKKQESGIYWTNSKEIADRWESKGCKVKSLDGVRGFSAYIFLF